MALTLALALIGMSQPRRWLIALVCIGIWVCIMYCFGGWAFRRKLSLAERLGRPMVLCVISGSASILYGWQFWPSVIVTPGHVAYDRSSQNQSYTFILRNNTGEDVYSVQTAFTAAHRVRFAIPKDSRNPIIDGSEIADTSALICRVADGHEVMVFLTHHLAPQASREFMFTNEEQDNEMTADVSYFTRDAQPRIDDPLKMSENFHPPQGSTECKALMFWLDPSRPPRQVEVQIRAR